VTRFSSFIFILLLIVSASFRLIDVGQGYSLYGDQGADLLAAHNWIKTGTPPLVGINTSIGTFHMGPLYYYLITPLIWIFNGDPFAPVVLFLIFGIGIVLVSFIYLSKRVDTKTAFIISFLLAISPHAISASRGAYSPYLEISFSILMLFVLHEFLKTKNLKYIFWTYFIIGSGLQMHYTFLANAISVSLIVFFFSKKTLTSYKFYLSASSGFLLPLLPFIIGQFFLNFQDFKGLFAYLLMEKPRAISLSSILDRIIYPFSVYYESDYLSWFFKMLSAPFYLGMLVIPVYVAFSKSNLRDCSRLVLAVFGLGVIQSIFSGLKFWFWYQDFFSITTLLLIGISISFLQSNKNTKWLSYLIFSICIIWSLYKPTDTLGFGRGPEVPPEVAKIILADIQKQPDRNYNFGILTDDLVSNDQGFEYRYFIERENFKTHTVKDIENADYLILESKLDKFEINLEKKKVEDKLIQIGEIDLSNKNYSVKTVVVFKVNKVKH
jgi:hypothetical protein